MNNHTRSTTLNTVDDLMQPIEAEFENIGN